MGSTSCSIGVKAVLWGGISALALWAHTAAAQTPEGDGLTDEPIGEIIVTAQKREQSLNEVGMSINAIPGDSLATLGINSSADLNRVVAGLSIVPPNTGIAGAPVYTMRGVGFNENSLSALSAVSFYVDQVPLPYVHMTGGPTLDIERVEVLKGPQGTLFGQNSTGGAINFIANRPTDGFEAGAEFNFSRFNRLDVEGFVSGPLSETLGARLALRRITADGWQESISRPGDTLGAVDQFAGRLLLDWAPSDVLRFELSLNGWLDRSESTAAQVIGFNPSVGAIFTPAFYPFYDDIVTNAVVKPDDARAADWTPGYDYENDKNFYQAALNTNWDLTDVLTLTSLTSYSGYDTDSFHDSDGSARDANTYNFTGTISSWNEELRLSGQAWDRLNWILGASYSSDEIASNIPSLTAESTVALAAGLLGGAPDSNSERTTQAVFGSVDFDLTPSVTFTGGARYTSVKLDYVGCTLGVGDAFSPAGVCFTDVGGVRGIARVSSDEDNVSWRAGLNWSPVDDLLIYGNVGRGYKSGDIPTLVAFFDTQLKPVVQEELTAYEIGVKGTFVDKTLQVNAAAFHYDYKDKQLYGFVFIPIVGVGESTINVPEATVDGGELELAWYPLDGLSLRAGVGYTKSEIGGGTPLTIAAFTTPVWPPAGPFASLGLVDVSGESFNLAPEWQANFDGQYDWHLANEGIAFTGATVVYASATLPTVGASKAAEIPSYTTLDLRVGYKAPDGKWEVSIWGRNVTDEVYAVSVTRAFDVTTRFTGMPATYGIRVSCRIN